MPVASLFNVPSTPEEWSQFSFANADHHLSIVNGVLAQKNISLPLYLLDPISLNDVASFLRIHQQAHSDFTAALGIEGVDLTDVDFRDPEQVASWTRLHGDEHMQAGQILGVG